MLKNQQHENGDENGETYGTRSICEATEQARTEAVVWQTETQERASEAAEEAKKAIFTRRLRDGTTCVSAMTPDQRAYIAAIGEYPTERTAAAAVRCTVQQVRRWRRDESFSLIEADAKADAIDALVADAWSAATEGRLVPIYQMGALIGYRREYSEKLHVELLKGLRPEVFDRRALKPEGAVNNTVIMASPDQIRDAVRRLSPTISHEIPVMKMLDKLPEL